jgi:phosphate transport system protein
VELAIEMLRDAHLAFIELDNKLAASVCARDDSVDALNREVIDDLVAMMQQHPERVEGSLHLFSASRIVERIGDHATNIAEDVMYMVEGAIRRHQLKVNKSA